MLHSAQAVAAEVSGPAKGSEAPLLHVAPVQGGATYCVTCKAGRLPCAVAFVAKDNDASRALISATDSAFRAGQEKKLHGAVVLTGEALRSDSLKAWIADQKLAIPVNAAGADNADLPAWKLNDKVVTTVVLVNQHKVVDSLADPTAESVKSGVAALTN